MHALHYFNAPPAYLYLTPSLSCCQVLDFPQQLPAEALEASYLLSSLLHPTNGPSTSGWNDQVLAYDEMHIHIGDCWHGHSHCILLACMFTPHIAGMYIILHPAGRIMSVAK